jgi:polar amino acid transport system substrate-binding protein
MPARVTVPRPRTSPSRRLGRAGSAAAAGVVLALVTACGGGDPATTTAGSAYDLIRPGVLTAGTQTEQPPFAFVGDDGKPTGFAVDLANEAAKRLGLSVDYRFTSLQGILSGLTAGAYDIGVAGVGATEERKRSVDFVKPYFWSYLAFLTPADSPVTEVGGLAGKRVGVVSGSVQETFATTKLTASQVIRFKDQPSAVGQLLTGGIDAFLVGGPDAEEYVEREKGRLRIAAEADSLQGTSLPIRKGDAALVTALDGAIDEIVADGTYERLYAKYFTRPVSPLLVAERPSLRTLAAKQSPTATP